MINIKYIRVIKLNPLSRNLMAAPSILYAVSQHLIVNQVMEQFKYESQNQQIIEARK